MFLFSCFSLPKAIRWKILENQITHPKIIKNDRVPFAGPCAVKLRLGNNHNTPFNYVNTGLLHTRGWFLEVAGGCVLVSRLFCFWVTCFSVSPERPLPHNELSFALQNKLPAKSLPAKLQPPFLKSCLQSLRCTIGDLSVPKTLRFRKRKNVAICTRAPREIAASFYFWTFGHLRPVFAVLKAKKHCDFEFAILIRSDLRFHSAMFLRFSCRTCSKSCDLQVAIQNAAICYAIFWDAKLGTQWLHTVVCLGVLSLVIMTGSFTA